ncbi:MAG: hypothetical protein AOA65_0978 [Candidatus Bathyarchaeota archaeon BA1]|nr:MAG: hypothetical protein AOA65_0978 [Candidatus Bathyarchaeota archaeon BA1]
MFSVHILILVLSLFAGLIFTAIGAACVASVMSQEGWSQATTIAENSKFSWSLAAAVDRLGNLHIVFPSKEGVEAIRYLKLSSRREVLVNTMVVRGYGFHSPVIALDRDGNVHIAWVDSRDGSAQVRYSKLDSEGLKVVPEVAVAPNLRNSFDLSLAVDLRGNTHLVWCDTQTGAAELYYCKLGVRGEILIPVRQITPTDRIRSTGPSVAIDAKGSVHILWLDDKYSEPMLYHELFYMRLGEHGEALLGETKIARVSKLVEPFKAPTALLHPEGDIYVIFVDERPRRNYGVFLKKFFENGTAASADLKLAGLQVRKNIGLPTSAIDLEGRIHVAFVDLRPEWGTRLLYEGQCYRVLFGDWRFKPFYFQLRAQVFYLKADREGVVLTRDTWLTAGLASSSSPLLCIDLEGNAHLFMMIYETGRYDIAYKTTSLTPQPFDPVLRCLNEAPRSWWLVVKLYPLLALANSLYFIFMLPAIFFIPYLASRWATFLHLRGKAYCLGFDFLILMMLKWLTLQYAGLTMMPSGGLSPILTAAAAALFLIAVTAHLKWRLTPQVCIVLGAVWMMIDFLYSLCLISPIVLEPIY